MICEAANDAEGSSSFRWFKVSDDDEDELTNVVGGGVSVAGGEISVDVSTLNNGDVFRCKLDDQVGGLLMNFHAHNYYFAFEHIYKPVSMKFPLIEFKIQEWDYNYQ